MKSEHASQVKRSGHVREIIFKQQFEDGNIRSLNDGVSLSFPGADGTITKERILSEVSYVVGETNGTASIKGGKTFQFHLGNLPELADPSSLVIDKIEVQAASGIKVVTRFRTSRTWQEQHDALKDVSFWNKYLKKGELLAIERDSEWLFFNMDDVISLITNTEKVRWRQIEETGRLKGDVLIRVNGKEKWRNAFTFEYRPTHKSFVLGSHGSTVAYKTFTPFLMQNLRYKVIRVMGRD